jgi:glycine/serine hydroxymethyltransferase
MKGGLEVLTGGTDNHLFLVNVRPSVSPAGKPKALSTNAASR